MEELGLKLAELLDITVESAIKLYPVLREQFIYYKMINWLWIALLFFSMIILAVCCIAYLTEIDHYDKMARYQSENPNDLSIEEIGELRNKFVNKIKISLVTSAILFLLSIAIKLSLYIYATDLMILMEYL